MKCFIDFVGLRYCSATEPVSGYYINYQPGISKLGLDKIANDEQQNYLGVWEDVQQRSALIFENKMLGHFSNSFKVNQVYQNDEFGQFSEGMPLVTAAAKFRGVYLYGSLYRYLALQIRSVRLYVDAPVTGAQFFVYDLNTGALLKTVTANLVAGYNVVQINLSNFNRSAQIERLFVCYNDSQFVTRQNLSNYTDAGGYGPSFCSDDCDYVGNRRVQAQSAEISNSSAPTYPAIEANNIGQGLQVQYNLYCSLEAYICEVRSLFTKPWVDLLSAELMNERIMSDRLNYYTMIDAEQALTFRDKYMEDFENGLKNILDNMNMPDDGLCFECNNIITPKYARP